MNAAKISLPLLTFVTLVLLLLTTAIQSSVAAQPFDESTLNNNHNNNGHSLQDCHDCPKKPPATTSTTSRGTWKRREMHHSSSSVMIAENNATLWCFPPTHRNDDDPINMMLKYIPPPQQRASRSYWKYEFACDKMPKMALSHLTGTVFAVACPAQQVRLHNGQRLTSQGGTVTLFQWNATKQRARIVQTIYGKNTTDQLGGQSVSLSATGTTLAIVASSSSSSVTSDTDNDDNKNNQQKQQQKPKTASSSSTIGYLDVYHYNSTLKKWQPLGQTIPGILKATLSSDGTLVAAMSKSKHILVYWYNSTCNEWTTEPFENSYYLRSLSSASMALAGNGQVLSLLQPSKFGQSVNIYRRRQQERTTKGQPSPLTFSWQLDSSIPKHHTQGPSFGWVASLNYDGTRIALAEPSRHHGAGAVYVYDYEALFHDWVPAGDPIVGTTARESLGRHLHLSQDGQQLIVKAISSTAIYEFDRSGSTPNHHNGEETNDTNRNRGKDEL